MGPLPCLTIASLLAVVAVVVAERRRARRSASAEDHGDETRPRDERGPMRASTAVALTLGAVALLAYVLFVIRAA